MGKVGKGTWALGALVVSFVAGMVSCGGPSKVTQIQERNLSATLALPQESDIPELEYRQAKRDTLTITDDSGREVLIMKAIRDDISGEMVATEVLNAAVVTARFRNVPERRGKVDLQFQITVPADLQDSKWQLRFFPEMYILEDTVRLEPVVITGKDYRKQQLKGYQQYEKFLSKIVADTTKFVDVKQLELFLSRNLPDVYAFKSVQDEVSDEVFYSYYGVTQQQALEHYTDKLARRKNKRRLANRQKMYDRYVKAPIVTEGIRLDTVMQNIDGDFVYNYIQTINTRKKLRKVDIVLSGDIFEQEKKVYTIPGSEPLTFYISSLSAFTDLSEHYLKRVIERRAQANASYKIEFAQGRADIELDRADNYTQIGFVKDNLTDLLNNEVYDLDSIVVVANASPEGSWATNGVLSKRRGEAVVRYFEDFMRDYRKQLTREGGFAVDEEGHIIAPKWNIPNIRFVTRSVPENWSLLDRMVREEERLTDEQKAKYFSYADIKDMDLRESRMRGDDYYRFLTDSLYNRLRVVDFAFHLVRKGMTKDTVQTTELDTRYMEGVQLLKDMEYEEAVKILGPYQDYNAAVAYMAAERNASALLILENLERTAQVNYLLAILYSRNGKEQEAVQCYMNACRQEPSYVHRGNLDPEISALIRLYGLNRQDEYDDDLGY